MSVAVQPPPFELQGHRGARALKPENTLPAFEVAFDLGVTSIETDVHLTADGIPILFHDSHVSDRICRPVPGSGASAPGPQLEISSLTLAQMRQYRADVNPDPNRFTDQDNQTTRLAHWFAQHHKIDAFTPPTLADLFAFAIAYAGDPGRMVGKTGEQQTRAQKIRFDLELKRVPFRPRVIGDGFDGQVLGILERRVIQVARESNMTDRICFRSFDHRCIRLLGELASEISRAILVAGTAPVSPADLTRQAGAQVYCPDLEFLDELQVRQVHQEGLRVIPWTVNDPQDWQKLVGWGVDGITTDFPDRLREFLSANGIAY
jgi:glycerophosphoryl diester phosphodiesterase